MKTILNPSEYKRQNPEAYLDDYLTYLEEAQKEAETDLQYAKSWSLDDSILSDIQKKAEEIFQMAMIVEEYMGQIVLKSIDTLSLEELQAYFDFEKENKEADKKRVSLEQEQEAVQSKLKQLNSSIQESLYANGRVKEFYEANDAKIFFQENQTPTSFLENLLKVFYNVTNIEEVYSKINLELQEQFIKALQTECSIQGIALSSDEVAAICDKILNLLKNSSRILIYSPNATNQLANKILSEEGIEALLPSSFEKNTTFYFIQGVMNLQKLDTTFYTNLPATLQDTLVSERLQGNTYAILFQTYQAFLKGEELPSDDLSQNEKKEQEDLNNQLSKINYDLTCLDTERDSQRQFLANEEAMRSVLRERISNVLEGQVSVKEIDSLIKDAERKNEKLKEDLVAASSLIALKESDLAKAQAILLDPDYHNFFQSVERNNVRRLYQAFGVNVTEEVILPFLEEEKRRYQQIDILVTLQNKLNSLYKTIKEKKDKANFITNKLPAYKEAMAQLEEEYEKAIEDAFQQLKKNSLFYINVPQISDESTIGHVITLPPAYQKEPETFMDVSGLKQTFWNMSTGIDENTKQRFLSKNPKFDNWEDYYQDLMRKQSELVAKLFSFGIGPDDYYHFTSSEEERETLKHLQTTIVEILSSIYDERKAFRQSLGTGSIILDNDKIKELEHFLGRGSNLSRENLVTYIDNTQSEIASLQTLLATNRELCTKLGVDVPEDTPVVDTTMDDESKDLEAKIQSLNIEGITNLEEAIAYRNLLSGLEEYSVPAGKVKEFYLRTVKK